MNCEPERDYYNRYHEVRKQLEHLQVAYTRLETQAKDNAKRLQRVLDAYAELEDKQDD